MAQSNKDIIAILEPYRGKYHKLDEELGKEGFVLLADHPEVNRSVSSACEWLGLPRTSIQGRISTIWAEAGIETRRRKPQRKPTSDPPSAPVTTHEALATTIYEMFRKDPHRRWTVAELSEHCDRSEKSVLAALELLQTAQYQVDHTEAGVRLVAGVPRGRMDSDVLVPELAERRLLLGVVSDTHLGNLCAAEDELAEVYERFAREGVQAVLHCGDLFDGPGNMGFAGHFREVREEAFTAIQQVRYASQHYPVARGFRTYFVSSSKAHDGWEWAKTGWHMGMALAEGTAELCLGKNGKEFGPPIAPRPDLQWLDFDAAMLWCGPEQRTSIYIHHPDGGTAYAWSYNVQQWANALEGGTKPHIALLGHYHKMVYCMPRNIHACEVPALCWQTPFMRRRRLPAHVGALLLDIDLDAGGGVQGFRVEMWPFYQREHSRYILDMSNWAENQG